MGYFTDSLRAMRVTLSNAFGKPVTVEFPSVVRPREERYRTGFALLHDANGEELCVACLACERICPSQVIAITAAPKRESPVTGKKRGYLEDFTLDMTACLFCELCVQVCPTDAIVMTRTPEVPGFVREDLCLTMEKLYANEGSKPATWGTGSRLMAMQDPARGTAPAPSTAPAASTTPGAAAAPATTGGTA